MDFTRQKKLLPNFMSQLLAACALAAWHPASSLGGGRGSGRAAHPAPQLSAATATDFSTLDAAVLFGRLCESKLYLDPAVGDCCHSACSDCEWRLPDGGYRFDLLTATRPKWIPCYIHRDFEDTRGSHTPRWVSAFFPAAAGGDVESAAPIDRAGFETALQDLAFDMPMGPRGNLNAETAALSAGALETIWSYLAGGEETLSAGRMIGRLQEMSLAEDRHGAVGEGPDSIDWKEFAKGLGAPPFERF